MAAPIWRVVAAMVNVGTDYHPLPLADQLAHSITGAAKAGEVNLSRQLFTHIPWTDKDRCFVQHRVGRYQWPANTPPLHIVGIGKARQHQTVG
ncbi:hypothetical protein OB962_04600 [Aeromonas piscicola]|uniref:Uncharacterized protein n=1 Tax=Aeromonas piscicola TaxID=600645 RepID=A0ABT7Q8M2_9GAMM|nr:hypothetical protein [Aeromonas piscicola]MDM5130285.1 hypothetical protein [Aeromonas piscicola]